MKKIIFLLMIFYSSVTYGGFFIGGGLSDVRYVIRIKDKGGIFVYTPDAVKNHNVISLIERFNFDLNVGYSINTFNFIITGSPEKTFGLSCGTDEGKCTKMRLRNYTAGFNKRMNAFAIGVKYVKIEGEFDREKSHLHGETIDGSLFAMNLGYTLSHFYIDYLFSLNNTATTKYDNAASSEVDISLSQLTLAYVKRF